MGHKSLFNSSHLQCELENREHLKDQDVNWPQIFKLINILACGLGFLCLIGFFLATQ